MATLRINEVVVKVKYDVATGIFDKKGMLFQTLGNIMPHDEYFVSDPQDMIGIQTREAGFRFRVGIYRADFINRKVNINISEISSMVEELFRTTRKILDIRTLKELEMYLEGEIELVRDEVAKNLQPQTREFLGKLENRFKNTQRKIISAVLSPVMIYNLNSLAGVILIQTLANPTKMGIFNTQMKYNEMSKKADIAIGNIENTLNLLDKEFTNLADLILK